MYECRNCGGQFYSPVIEYDDPSPAGVGLPSGAYSTETCPNCGSDDIEEANECPACGSWHIRDGALCPDCFDRIGEGLEELRKDLNLTEDDFEEEIVRHYGW